MDVDEFLAHHGVLGMKWGIRKKNEMLPNNSKQHSKLSDKQKKILIAAGISVGVGALAVGLILAKPKITDAFELKKASNLLMSELKDNPGVKTGKDFVDGYLTNDVNVPQGVSFHRVASKLESAVNTPKYATYLKPDVLKYRADWNVPYGNKNSQLFKTVFKTVSDSKIAGQNTLKSTISEVASQNSHLSGRMRSEIISYYKGAYNHDYMKNLYSKASTSEVANQWMKLQTGRQWKSPIASMVLEELRKKNYVGLVDSNDTKYLANHAVVLINDSLVKTVGSKMTSYDRQAALKLMREVLKN